MSVDGFGPQPFAYVRRAGKCADNDSHSRCAAWTELGEALITEGAFALAAVWATLGDVLGRDGQGAARCTPQGGNQERAGGGMNTAGEVAAICTCAGSDYAERGHAD